LAEGRYFQAHRMKDMAEPERALLLAVLSEAIDTFRRFALSRSARGQRLFRQAKEWLWDDEADYFFSCRNICEVMGLDASYLRRGLLQWLEKNSDFVCERKSNTVFFARIGRARSRTVYTQRRSMMFPRSLAREAGARGDADHHRAAISHVNSSG
jgi:hypothetical protein